MNYYEHIPSYRHTVSRTQELIMEDGEVEDKEVDRLQQKLQKAMDERPWGRDDTTRGPARGVGERLAALAFAPQRPHDDCYLQVLTFRNAYELVSVLVCTNTHHRRHYYGLCGILGQWRSDSRKQPFTRVHRSGRSSARSRGRWRWKTCSPNCRWTPKLETTASIDSCRRCRVR